ncbi:MAG: bifunctional 4-hydroxy-2-oxoglutarate aldolase/2-dehydro-3-deoxy-phosphogluconate aldolase [Planctomycetes bacterium]|nr:bifunctional 4-hydroxy-2-oxoglutarate aldolase/2-dehydro-3-deoxy-phosphogluconate aldolase [Planctomycetota bacterium]
MDLIPTLASLKIVPVVVIDDAAKSAPLGAALKAGGLPCAEITFRTAAAAAAIKAMSADRDILVGAGTVLTVDHAKAAVDAGARFLVSPGFGPKVVEWALANQVPIIPGVVTPTEIQMALEYGLTVVKFFPAGSFGGAKTLKGLAAVYGGLRFVPTGGIDASNIGEYLAIKAVAACGGSWICTNELITAGDWAKVTTLTAEAVAATRR